MRLQWASSVLAIALCALMRARASDSSSVRNRNNLFDPVFAYDENDAHSVSASLPSQRPSIEKRERAQFYQELDATEPQLTSAGRLPIKPMDYLEAARKQQAAASFGEPVAKKEEPKHWSALENYYQVVRAAAGGGQKSVVQQQPHLEHTNAQFDLPIYQVLQQESEEPLAGYKPIEGRPYSQVVYPASGSVSVRQKVSPFNYPMVSSLPANSDPDFGFASVHHNAAPGISRQASAASKAASSNLEWRKLAEMLLEQQQQERVKHQQKTFGSWYDQQRSRELLREEAFCGPRNYIAARPSSAAASVGPDVSQSRLELNSDASVEFPSHMGVYNGSKPSEDNFLCAATWIHDRFALTLATCVASLKPNELSVRANEWNLNRNASREMPMITRQVEEVQLFSSNDSFEHNLAMLKFTKPLEYLELTFGCPACQKQSRMAMRTDACWAPVRNTSISEYFDADGEGETRERKSAKMIELPVRLIANDDDQCHRLTKLSLFNKNHPNYICSGDVRTSAWRQHLNQSQYFGSGIYCNEEGNLSLVSMLQPIRLNSLSAFGYIDLSFYRPWMRKVIFGYTY